MPILTSALLSLGLASPAAQPPPVINPAPVTGQHQSAPAQRAPATTPSRTGNTPAIGNDPIFLSPTGHSPEVWGTSAACRQMVHKNKRLARRSKHYRGKRR